MTTSHQETEDGLDEFWDELLRRAEVAGEPQQTAFFEMYAEAAAENGDCADLTHSPIRREGSRPYQIDGYAFDPDRGELQLAICDFRPRGELQSLAREPLDRLTRRARRFCEQSVRREFLGSLEEVSHAFQLAWLIFDNRTRIRRIRCLVFSNARLATQRKTLEPEEVFGVEMTFNVIDFQRYRDLVTSSGAFEPIELRVRELNAGPLACLEAHLGDSRYKSYLVVMPGTLLARIYALHGARLMEQNVRTFLQARTKTNAGIIETARSKPEMFFAFNNGITATASDVELEPTADGSPGIAVIRGLQIVNGGQTTASLLHARDRGDADLERVFLQMKLSVISEDVLSEVVPQISRYSNTQNRITEADFFASHPFHVEMEKLSRRISAPAAEGALAATKWFYERARGQYRNELSLRSPPDRRRFQAEFPRSQVVQKTDFGKYRLTFEAQPHVVSLGAQKCFLRYAEEVSRDWEDDREQFDDRHFRDTIAMAIVFRWTDAMIAQSEWYKADRGYKANIVTYTIAWLVDHLRKTRSQRLDLDLIWRRQTLPGELASALASLAPQIAKWLKSPPVGVSNISEYAKTPDCWMAASETSFEIAELPRSVTASPEQPGHGSAGRWRPFGRLFGGGSA